MLNERAGYLKDYSPKTKVVLADCFGSALHSWATTGQCCPSAANVDSEGAGDEGTEKVLAGERWCPKPKMSQGSSPVTEGIGNRYYLVHSRRALENIGKD